MEKNRYNILLVHCHYRLAGGEDAVFADEKAMLERHGHQVFTYERTNEGGALAMGLEAVFSWKTWREVRALIRRHHIDIVHVHNTLLTVSPSVFWAARSLGVPVVQTLHNFRIFCPNGVLLRDGRVCEDCPRRKGGLWQAVRYRCYRDSLAQSAVCAFVYAFHRLLGTYRWVTLITLTDFDRQKLLEFNTLHRVFDPARLCVKPNALAPEDPLPPVLPRSRRKNQIVFAGRLEELKGLRTALEGWKRLPESHDTPELLVVGDGPLADWAAEQAVPRVRLLGRLPRAELHALFGQSLGVLAPSLCYESFALVPAEAHLMGTPVLASDLGNVGAMVRPGVDGLRFTPGDPDALATAVQALPGLWDKADPDAMRAGALAAFAPEENYRRLMEIYRAVLTGTPAPQ